VKTALGTIVIELDETSAITELRFEQDTPGGAPVSDAGRRLLRYFDGDLQAFEGLRLAPKGTPFQQSVWAALQRIPAGETRSYGDLARELHSSARAVGGANGRNPIAVIIPCHRVIAADGTLGGYSGGLDKKRFLLSHELKTPLFPGR
jgi:methylated-DNA-[protein]-cysteine S-methyltransferase